MRNLIIDDIFQQMKIDESIFFMTADMGINLVEKFKDNFPDRFANVSIAEQNLIGIASGLANVGYKPFVYSISNFLIHRCLEQVRNDIIFHKYPITLVGTSTGFDNAPLGPTHHVIDDWGMLKSLPTIDVYCPSTKEYASTLIGRILKQGNPSYIRIPKGDFTEPKSADDIVYIEKNLKDTIYISYGGLSQYVLKQKPNSSHLIFNKLHPIDKTTVLDILQNYSRAIVVEDHFASTGLYSSLATILVNEKSPLLNSLSPQQYDFSVGESPAYFHKKFALLESM